MTQDSGASAFVQLAQTDPKLAELDETTKLIRAEAAHFVITNADDYNDVASTLKEIKIKQRDLDNLRHSITRPIDEAKARIMGMFRPASTRLAEAEAEAKKAMLDFKRSEENRRREEEARVRAEADAERQRLQDEALAQRDEGHDDTAAMLEDEAASLPVPIVSAAPLAVPGISTRVSWRAEVDDFPALVKAVVAGAQPMTLLLPNMVILNAQAKALKAQLTIPGVRPVSEEGIAARTDR